MKQIEKSQKYEQLKIIITVLVVVGHITRMYTNEGAISIESTSLILNYICRFIYGFHMPLFFLVSGAIYHFCIFSLSKYKIKKYFIINKFKRLIIPYFAFVFFM